MKDVCILAVMTRVDTELYLIICMMTSRLLDAGTSCNNDAHISCYLVGLINAITYEVGW